MEPVLREKEHIETISDRLRLIVSPEHTFGTDALLLAAFALPKRGGNVCDLGAGCGIIPFYWLARGVQRATAVELQAQAADQMVRSARLSGITDRLRVVNADLRRLGGILPEGAFDAVSMNPPYFKAGHGITSSAAADAIARHETETTLEDCCECAAKLLKYGGSFSVCMPPARLAETVCAMREAKMEPKRLRFVSKNADAAPWLFLLESKKGRAPGMTVENPLFLYGPDGGETEALREITAPYRKD